MRVILSVLTAAAAVTIALPAGAQQNKDKDKKKEEAKVRVGGPERCISEDGRIECRIFRKADMDSILMKRAAIGVQLQSTGSMRDTIGVFVARVTPKGPAENAGVVEGDRIISINGVDLRVNSADAGDSYASGLPARRLTREVQKLSPGNVINLRVWSGGRVRDVQVTAGRASDLRESGFFGAMFDGMGGMLGDMPNMRIQSFPKMRMPEFERMHFDDLPFRFEELPKMKLDGMRKKLMELESDGAMRHPLVRVYTRPGARSLIIGDSIVVEKPKSKKK